MEVLKSRPDAAGAFEELVRRGHLAGQLYGLEGLCAVSPEAFATRVKPYLEDQRVVEWQGGCLSGRTTVAAVCREIIDSDRVARARGWRK